MMRRIFAFTFVAVAAAWGGSSASAGEIGHYTPSLLNTRDFYVPAPGFYGAIYNYYYTTDQINDSHGDEIDSLTLVRRDGAEVTLDLDVDVDVYVLAPTLIWVSEWEVLGARYGALITPAFANSSVGASLATHTGRGLDSDSSSFGVGDLYVQPLWLGWPLKHWDFALAYGFYAPTGKYDTDIVDFPIIGDRRVESTDNIGLGFWTHQFQGAVAWYPWENRGTAVTTALTYEIHDDKEDFDFTPGQVLSLNYGLSQYLPLNKKKDLLLDAGPAGYSSWQITDDEGDDAANDVHDEVHGIGGQIGLTYLPWEASLTAHYFHEYSAEDRFEGDAVTVSIAKKF